jgi:hypothetical protein
MSTPITTSVFLARLIGPVFVAVGVGLLINFPAYQAIVADFLRSYALVYVSGVIVLVAGLAIVNVHNIWTRDWRVIITILGWLMTIGGIIRIVAPRFVMSVTASMFSHTYAVIAGICLVLLGAFLAYQGYSNNPSHAGVLK